VSASTAVTSLAAALSALIPLGSRAELGLLAIGARSEDQFAPTLGTVYLTHIGELVATALAPRLR